MKAFKRNQHEGSGVLTLAFASLGVILSFFFCPLAYSAQTSPQSNTETVKPIQIGISKSQYLPEEMYGYWSVTGAMIEANAPEFFRTVTQDIWVLEQHDGQVIISNPVSGARASISVEKVEGNTATFQRTVVLPGQQVKFEMPTVTVDGDRLFGTTINEFRILKQGKVARSYYARYRLTARRIGGEKVRMQSNNGPNIEIDDSKLGR